MLVTHSRFELTGLDSGSLPAAEDCRHVFLTLTTIPGRDRFMFESLSSFLSTKLLKQHSEQLFPHVCW